MHVAHLNHSPPRLLSLRAMAAAPPQRLVALAQHALPFAQAFQTVRRSGAADLGLDQFSPQGCIDLEVDFQLPLELLLRDGDAGLQSRLHLLQQLLTALQVEHKDLIRGWASAPHQRDWGKVKSLRFLVNNTDAAQAALIAAVQAQALEVKLRDSVVRLPVRGVAGRLPVDTVQLEIRGIPDDCARCGVTAAVVRAAGYGPAQGVNVLHERLGMVRGPTGERQPFGRMDMVVAVVSAPVKDPYLLRLPGEVRSESFTLTMDLHSCLAPPAVRLSSSPSQQPRAAPSHTQVMDQLGSAHGLTPQVRQAGPSPVAAEAARLARPSGSRAGLGFPSPSQVPPPLPPIPSQPAHSALPDEPLFGTAVEYLQDYSELCQAEIHKVVLAVKTSHLLEYNASLGASRAGDLPGALKLLLHTQAQSLFGQRGGVPDTVAAAWGDDPGEEQVGQDVVGEVSRDSMSEHRGPAQAALQQVGRGVLREVGGDTMSEDGCPPQAGETQVGRGGVGVADGDVMSEDGSPAEAKDLDMLAAGDEGGAVAICGNQQQQQQQQHISPYPRRDRRPALDSQGSPAYLNFQPCSSTPIAGPTAPPSTASKPAGRGRGRRS